MPAKTVQPTTRQRPPVPAQAAQAVQQALPWPAERKGRLSTPSRRSAHPVQSFAPGAGLHASTSRTRARCGGCTPEHPPAECAACGLADTVITLADPDFPHVITLCRACARVLIAARQESRKEAAVAQTDEARGRMRQAALTRSAAARSHGPAATTQDADDDGHDDATPSASASRSLVTGASGRKRGAA